jgi:hypothetical protein
MVSRGVGRGRRRPCASAMDVEGVRHRRLVPRVEVIAVPAAAPGRGRRHRTRSGLLPRTHLGCCIVAAPSLLPAQRKNE